MTDQIKLTDTQTVILSLAARHDGGVSLDGVKASVQVANPKRAADALVKRGLLRAAKVRVPDLTVPLDGYAITAAGKAAIGIEDAEPEPKKAKGTPADQGKAAAKADDEARAEALALANQIAAGEIRATEKRLAAIAEAGVMPPPPDFSDEIHKTFRKYLEPMVAAASAGDIKTLRAWEPHRRNSTDLKAIDRFRRYAIVAIERGATAA